MGRSRGETTGSDLQTLRASEIGGALAPAAAARLVRAARVEEHGRDAVVHERGASAARFCVVSSGRVRVVRETPEGREMILAHRRAGSLVGEWGLLGRPSHEDTGRVSEDSRLLSIPCAMVREMADVDAKLQTAILALATARRLAAESLAESLATRTARSRLADFLVEAAKKDGVPDPRGIRIRSRYTHLEIACTIGATRETTTLTLDEMKRHGLVIVERRSLVVRDVAKLRALV
jgi:CRP-like cAMP-binding protein